MLRSGDVVLASAGMISARGPRIVGLRLMTALHRRGRLGRCAGGVGFTIVTALVALILVPAVMATNVPATELDVADPAFFGLSFENVTFDTSDGVTLSAWYIPSTNHAAVVIRHGAGSTRSDVLPQTLVLAHHGYGVLSRSASPARSNVPPPRRSC